MAKCDFSIEFTDSAESLVAKANASIAGAGGKFAGDTNEGGFELSTPLGPVKGSYTISASAIHIHIADKPLFLGCDRIEKELKNYLARQA